MLRELVYSFYEKRLTTDVRQGKMPGHVGLILDGNRRFAEEKGWNSVDGHQKGADKIDEVLQWCEDLSIPVITLWALSTENLERAGAELDDLLGVIEGKIRALGTDERTHERGMRIQALGRLDTLPESTQTALKDAETATASHGKYLLNIAVGYGGRQEILDAFQRLILTKAEEGKDPKTIAAEIDAKEIERHLYTVDLPDPDLIIRTSGEVRLSGFLLWQAAYSEYYFCEAFWPEFRRIDFLRAIRSYQARHRRFGK